MKRALTLVLMMCVLSVPSKRSTITLERGMIQTWDPTIGWSVTTKSPTRYIMRVWSDGTVEQWL